MLFQITNKCLMGSPHCMDNSNPDGGMMTRETFSKEELEKIRDLAREGKKIVDAKNDGKMHRIQVVAHTIEKSNPFNREFVGREFTLLVDDEWVGGLNPVNMKGIVCDFEWESLVP